MLNYRKTVFSANLVRYSSNVYEIVLEITSVFVAVRTGDGIYNQMIVQVLMVKMRCNDHLVFIRKQTLLSLIHI